ncbi:MAG TPA: hypothetical protein DEP03_02045, partial [Massilia sp.]|nr:hypothetical protein [Massilia sp.]
MVSRIPDTPRTMTGAVLLAAVLLLCGCATAPVQPVAVEPEIHTMTRDDALRLAGEAERVLAAGR